MRLTLKSLYQRKQIKKLGYLGTLSQKFISASIGILNKYSGSYWSDMGLNTGLSTKKNVFGAKPSMFSFFKKPERCCSAAQCNKVQFIALQQRTLQISLGFRYWPRVKGCVMDSAVQPSLDMPTHLYHRWNQSVLNKRSISQLFFATHRFFSWRIKNPAYGRSWISRPMRIVAPIPKRTEVDNFCFFIQM